MNRLPILIDCDPGHDDAIALFLAARSAELEVLGVTTVAGNASLVNTTRNARRLLDLVGAAAVPVCAGCDRPLMAAAPMEGAVHIHGADGLGGVSLPEAAAEVLPGHAVEFMSDTLRRASQKVTLVPLGPLTNIALLLTLAPDVKEKIEKIVIMGGAVRAPGNITTAAEFNIWYDPEAAKIVLQSGCEIELVTLDVTMKAYFTRENIAALGAAEAAHCRVAAKLLEKYESAYQRQGQAYCYIHDALCVASLLDPALLTWERVFVDVATHDSLSRGATVADLSGRGGQAPNCRIGVTVDRDRFVALLMERLLGA